jgi:hypothetical protein
VFDKRNAHRFLCVAAVIPAVIVVAFRGEWYGRRLFLGAFPAVAMLAVAFAFACAQRRGRESRPLVVGFAAIAAASSPTFVTASLARANALLHGEAEGDRTTLRAHEAHALQWIDAHADRAATVQPLPWVVAEQGAVAVVDSTLLNARPMLTGRAQPCCHRIDTPDSPARKRIVVVATQALRSGRVRNATPIVDDLRADFLVSSQGDFPDAPPPLRLVYAEGETRVYATSDAAVRRLR